MSHRRLFALFGMAFLVAIVLSAVMGEITPHPLLAQSPILQLTADRSTNVRPIWSPDGRSVAYQSNRGDNGNYHIWIMNADGKNQRALTNGGSDDRHPFWSPDGKQIVYDSSNGGAREVWTVNSDGNNRRQITHLEQEVSFPAFNADSSMISFYSYKDGVMSLWIVGADGSNPKPLIPSLADQRLNQCTFACHQALWSPDGKKITYTGGDHTTIWVMNADGSNQVQLSKGNGGEHEHQHFPWWLGDGRIGYIVENVTPAESWTDAWAVPSSGGSPTLLYGKITHQGPFEWSPDGSKVLFHSPRSGNFNIYLVDLRAAGGTEAFQGALGAPAASPAGQTAPPAPPVTATQSSSANQPNAIFLFGGVLSVGIIAALAVVVAARRKR